MPGKYAEVLADYVEVEWGPHDDGAVAAKNRDGALRPETEAAEQVVKIAKADRASDHATKASFGIGDAPAEHDGIGAVMQHRTADVEARVGSVVVNLEILLVAAIFGGRIHRRGIDNQFSVGVEHLDRAEMLRGCCMVEQDQLPDRLADLADLRRHHVARDGAQRQVEKLDVAADVGIDTGCKVLEGLARQFFLAAAHVDHDAGADGGKADNRRH